MKSKKITHLYHQFGGLLSPLNLSSFGAMEIAEALEQDGLITINGDRYTETPKMRSIQVLDEYIKKLLETAL